MTMTRNERVREARKALNLTLEKFGSKIGVGRSAISAVETGAHNLSEQMAISICREYRVNYDWLMNGDGDMFEDLPRTVIDELCEQFGCDDTDRAIIEAYLNLTPDERSVLKKYIDYIISLKE